MKEIIRAENSGFCFGVKQAMEKTEEQIKIKEISGNEGRIYTCGPLIHNTLVTDDLARRGVGIISDPEEADAGDVVIVRSHGETKEFFEKVQGTGIRDIKTQRGFYSLFVMMIVLENNNQTKYLKKIPR